jgi:tRNA(Ile)-lysidine synthetase-like protein
MSESINAKYQLQKKFNAQINKWFGNSQSPPSCFALACSGGVDSIVLLDLFIHYLSVQKKIHPTLYVFYIDHRLRTDTELDQQCIAKVISGFSEKKLQSTIHFVSEKIVKEKNNNEASLRKRRYQKLSELLHQHAPEAPLFTAHHLDDQLETYLLKLMRGTHPASFKAMSPRTKIFELEIFRPLLTIPKKNLKQYALHKNLLWNEDSTNSSSQYLRNRIRLELIPLLESLRPKSSQHLLNFFNSIAVLPDAAPASKSIQSSALLLESLQSSLGLNTLSHCFEELKSAILYYYSSHRFQTSAAYYEKANSITRGHWESVKKILATRQKSKLGSGEKKIVQFPGNIELLFLKNKIFLTKKTSSPS